MSLCINTCILLLYFTSITTVAKRKQTHFKTSSYTLRNIFINCAEKRMISKHDTRTLCTISRTCFLLSWNNWVLVKNIYSIKPEWYTCFMHVYNYFFVLWEKKWGVYLYFKTENPKIRHITWPTCFSCFINFCNKLNRNILAKPCTLVYCNCLAVCKLSKGAQGITFKYTFKNCLKF